MTSTAHRVRHAAWVAALATPLLLPGLAALSPAYGATTTPLSWRTVVNNADAVPGTTKLFNSYTQPSVNTRGLVVFRGRTTGPEPVHGVFLRNALVAGSPVDVVATTGATVPAPNNLGATFNEFPSFPRIARASGVVATRAQSTPVWQYTLPDGTDTRVGTSGVYALDGGRLVTAASLLGNVPGFGYFAVPGAAPGTRFDQFPGAPSVDGRRIVFKGNYTENGVGRTGVFFRGLWSGTNPVRLIANTSTRIPNQPADGTATFGSTAPPSSSGGRTVFVGLDNEDAPTLGGVYLADTVSNPRLRTLVAIGGQVPGGTTADRFTGFGEGLSFDGRYVGFAGWWGTERTTITLTCPTDGNADLIAYCRAQYPDGYTTSVSTHQGIFVTDTQTGVTTRAASTDEAATAFSGFQYWVFSGRPPGTGGGDEPTLEPPRWRSSAFVSASATPAGPYQVVFKATRTDGTTGIYLVHQNRRTTATTLVDTTTPGSAIDPEAPAGSTVSAVGLEREGLRGRWLTVTVSMLDAATAESFAGIYLANVPATLGR
ncbi:MAG: DUF7453 family protein [Angustibacter sp.]